MRLKDSKLSLKDKIKSLDTNNLEPKSLNAKRDLQLSKQARPVFSLVYRERLGLSR